MLMFLGYLFMSGITSVKAAEGFNFSNTAEFQTMKTRLEYLYKKFAYTELVAKSDDDFQNTCVKALKSEKLERIKFTSNMEKQVNKVLEAYDTVTVLLKEQEKNLKRNSHHLRNLSDNVNINTEELSIIQENHRDHVARVQRMFYTLSKMLGKCGSNTNQKWIQRGNTCYYFSFERVTWNEAVENCKGMKARLVTIEDEEENTFLVNQVREQRVCYRDRKKYVGTVSTTRGGIMCQRWDSQIPHNHEYTEGWRFPEGSATDAANYCRDPNDDLEPNTPWCYTVSSETRFEECSIPKCAETDETETIFWIGLNDVRNEGVWEWEGDDLFLPMTYTNWGQQQPDDFDGNEDCGVIWVDRGGQWNDGSCGNRYGFVCETPEVI